MPHSVSLETPSTGIMATMTVSSRTTSGTTTRSATRRKAEQPTEAPNVDHLDRHGYLFGQKITASLSPLLHDTIYQEIGLNWAQVRLDSTDMDLFLQLRQHPKFYGRVPSAQPVMTQPVLTQDNRRSSNNATQSRHPVTSG